MQFNSQMIRIFFMSKIGSLLLQYLFSCFFFVLNNRLNKVGIILLLGNPKDSWFEESEYEAQQ